MTSASWPTLRAAAITVVIAVQLLIAAPVPHAVPRPLLNSPSGRIQVETWAVRLTSWGLPITVPDLSDRVVDVTGRMHRAHRALIRPFRPFMKLTGTGQGWALFASPARVSEHLELLVTRPGGTSEVIYRQLDPDHDWWARRLRYRRLRGVWSTGGFREQPRPSYVRFSRWIADRVFEERPDVETVTMRKVRQRIPLPGATGDPPPKRIIHAVQHERRSP